MNVCDCELIQDALIDYINHRLSQSACFRIVSHLSGCKKCRDEAAFLFRIKQSQLAETVDIPSDMIESAFIKIPDGRSKFESNDYFTAIYESLQLIGLTLRFARKII